LKLHKIAFIAGLALTLVSTGSLVADAKEKINDNPQLLVIKKSKYGKTAQELSKIDGIDMTELEEISLIRINQQTQEGEDALNDYIHAHPNSFEAYGADLLVLPPSTDIIVSKNTDLMVPFALSGDFFDEWGWNIHDMTNNGETHDKQPGTHEIVVGIIDSGIDHRHPDLEQNIVSGNAHSSWVIEAIVAAVDDGVDIINLSLGTYLFMSEDGAEGTLVGYEQALAYAEEHDVVVVAASGTRERGLDISDSTNLAAQLGLTGEEVVYAPGSLDGVITVSGSNRNQQMTHLSNYGEVVDISAPSGDYGPKYEENGSFDFHYFIMTTYPTDLEPSLINRYLGFDRGYDLSAGTSLAAPQVSATIALMLAEAEEANRMLTPREVAKIIKETASPYQPGPHTKKESAGIINPAMALDAIDE
jgi:lantibiotic leader peptide-processing serine protease